MSINSIQAVSCRHAVLRRYPSCYPVALALLNECCPLAWATLHANLGRTWNGSRKLDMEVRTWKKGSGASPCLRVDPKGFRVASVVPEELQRWVKRCPGLRPITSREVIEGTEDYPTLGVDRALALRGASRLRYSPYASMVPFRLHPHQLGRGALERPEVGSSVEQWCRFASDPTLPVLAAVPLPIRHSVHQKNPLFSQTQRNSVSARSIPSCLRPRDLVWKHTHRLRIRQSKHRSVVYGSEPRLRHHRSQKQEQRLES